MTRVWDVATSGELLEAFAQARGGDQINLSEGYFGGIVLEGRSFSNPVTVSGAPGGASVFESLVLKNIAGLAMEHLSVHPHAFDTSLLDLITITGGTNIRLSSIDISGTIPTAGDGALPKHGITDQSLVGRPIIGFAYHRGLRIRESTGVLVERSEISGVRTGIVLHEVQSVSIDKNHLHRIRSDGVAIADAADVRITGNLMYQFTPFRNMVVPALSDHPDFVQWWTSPGGGIEELEISGNVLLQGQTGWIQGIFGRGRASPAGLDARAIQITDNLINTSHPNAIVVGNAHDVEIRRNMLVPAPVDPALAMATSGLPGIFVRADRPDGNSVLPRDLSVSENVIIDGRMPAFLGFPTATQTVLEEASRNNSVVDSIEGMAACAPAPVDLSGCMQSLSAGNAIGRLLDLPAWMQSTAFAIPQREDRIFGSQASEILTGTRGSDVFLGNGGSDVIHLGGGADQVVLNRRDMRPGEVVRIEGLEASSDLRVVFSGGFPLHFFQNGTAEPAEEVHVFAAGRSAIVSVPDGFLALAQHDRFSILKDGEQGWAVLVDLDRNGDPDWAMLFPTVEAGSGASAQTATLGFASFPESWICALANEGC